MPNAKMKKEIKIMIVEDEAIAALGMQYALTSCGYTVLEPLSSGEEAVKKFKQDRPDIVLLDIYLEGNMDGIQAALKIRSISDTPIIFITGYQDEDILEKINSIESSIFLLKPVETREIESAIDQVLGKRSTEAPSA